MNKKSTESKGASVEAKMAEAYKLIRMLEAAQVQGQQIAAKLKEVNEEVAKLEAKDKDGS